MHNEITDVLIIGAGPAGTAAAAILNSKGFKVSILEKTQFPRFVIGESLLPRCMDLLEETNLLDAVKAEGFQEKFGAKFVHGNKVCDFNFEEQYTDGYTWTWQVTRADFDKKLADTVEERGVHIQYQAEVTNVEFENKIVTTHFTKNGVQRTITSKYIIDASGYGRVLPRLLSLDKPSNLPPRGALITHLKDSYRPQNEEGNRIKVVVVKNDVWIWIIPFSNGNTSIGIVGDLSHYDSSLSEKEIFLQVLQEQPELEQRFASPEFIFEPRKMVGYSCAVERFYGDQFVLVGNTTEFLDPIFSSGVTFALESGVKAAKLVAKELNNEPVNWEEEYVAYMDQGIQTFKSYVDHWYDGTLQKIFFAKNIDQSIKERICSVLAGYVWDDTNPYVKKHQKALKILAKVITIQGDY